MKRAHHHVPVSGFVTFNQSASPGQSGIATANELDQHGAPFTISDPSALVWAVSDTTNLSITPATDGTPTAKVTVSPTAVAGAYTVTFKDPAAPGIPITAGTVTVVVAPAVATSGSVDLGPFA